ncbi:MAG: type II toxin-antitoxin system VapC family toxin [Acidobacteria bacterium]|nr:type II toxin-antitoxin system VapC family toxin [Acidobacteriota bacterium]
MRGPYLDTSALAKWYLNEARSEEFEAFLRQQSDAAISRLTVLEFRCLLARRRRSRELSDRLEKQVWSTFEADLRAGHLAVHPLEDAHVLLAIDLLARLRAHPLRTLDALHLAVALGAGCTAIATADRVLAGAATALGLEAVPFY